MAFSKPKIHMDHIFGDIDLPEHSASWLHERYSGVRHLHNRHPLNPKPGDAVQLEVTTSMDLPVESVQLWMTTDDWQSHTEVNFAYIHTIWETALWSYLKVWKVDLPSQPVDTMLRYKIGAKLQGSDTIIYAESQTHSLNSATNYAIWFNDDVIPEWVDDAIIYQIFVDRFNPGEEQGWNGQDSLKKPMGGTLKGVTEKFPISTLWDLIRFGLRRFSKAHRIMGTTSAIITKLTHGWAQKMIFSSCWIVPIRTRSKLF
jgi:cyclomaltodextrinase / maltogenic alpha-amylase / neopullulanase